MSRLLHVTWKAHQKEGVAVDCGNGVYQFRRTLDGGTEWFAKETGEWVRFAGTHIRASRILTEAGFPEHIELYYEFFEPTSLEGTWTRFYWRTVETVALWWRVGRWLFTGKHCPTAGLYEPR